MLLYAKPELSDNKTYLPLRHSFLKTGLLIFAPLSGMNIIRGTRSTTIRDEARVCAERMGYHWLANTDSTLPFDGLMYRMAAVVAVRLKKVRYTLSDDCIVEKKFPEEVKALQTLPMPAFVLRELWIRTQNERAWRRFYILPETTAEIEFNTAENYRNTHFREKDWENAPFRLDIPLPLLPSKLARKRDEIRYSRKRLLLTNGRRSFFSHGNRVHTHGKY